MLPSGCRCAHTPAACHERALARAEERYDTAQAVLHTARELRLAQAEYEEAAKEFARVRNIRYILLDSQ